MARMCQQRAGSTIIPMNPKPTYRYLSILPSLGPDNVYFTIVFARVRLKPTCFTVLCGVSGSLPAIFGHRELQESIGRLPPKRLRPTRAMFEDNTIIYNTLWRLVCCRLCFGSANHRNL